jgi:hypothetical protein
VIEEFRGAGESNECKINDEPSEQACLHNPAITSPNKFGLGTWGEGDGKEVYTSTIDE